MKAVTNAVELLEKDKGQLIENGLNKKTCYTFPIIAEVAFLINKIQTSFK